MNVQAATADRKPLHRGLITVSIMLATIMQALDTTIANVALPHMQGTLSATSDQISWVLTSYIVAAAIMTPPTGILAARFGRKRIFAFSVAGFTIASMLCGIAQSLPEMILFRLLQGVFGASLVPLSQSVLLDINPKERHGQAMAIWGMGVMLGPILGPTLGGWLTEYYDWRWVFFINVPIGIAAFAGMMTFLPETAIDKTRRFDWFGFTALSLAIGAMQMTLDRGESQDWFSSGEIIIEALLAGVALYMFLAHILTTRKHPFLDPAMFRDRNYSFCLIFIFVIGIILLATMALLPPYLQGLMGYPVITTGLVLAPRGIGTMVAMMLVGRLMGRVDARGLILFGLLLTAYTLWQTSRFNLEVPTSMIVHVGILQGFGMGFVFVPLSALAYATLDPKYRNDATSIFSLMRNIGSSVGIAIMIALATRYTQVNHAELGAKLTTFNPVINAASDSLQTATGIDNTGMAAILNGEVTRQAAAISYLNDFHLMMYVVLASLPLLLMMKPPKRAASNPEHPAVIE